MQPLPFETVLMSDILSPDQVAARIDRLPMGRFQYRFLGLVALGAWFDYYDNFVAAALVHILLKAGVIPKTEPGQWLSIEGLFMASLPLGMFVGTIVFGLTSDYVGRRFGFVLMLLLYSVSSFAGGAGYYPLLMWAGPTAALVLLLISRALAGAGVGAENVIIDAYVSEMVPRQVRGRSVALVHATAFTAVPVVFFLAQVISADKWWLLLIIGSLGALFAWYFRRHLPESPRWLAASARPAEAAAVLAEIEAAVGRESDRPLSPDPVEPPLLSVPRAPFRELWSPRYRGRTLLLVLFHLLQTIGYYGFMHWLVTLLAAKGFQKEALVLPFFPSLLAPVGPLIGVWSSERWQRKWLIVGLTAAVGVLMVGFGLALNVVLLTILAAGIIVGLNWFSAVFHAYQAELFPTAARATGVGFTYAWSRASMVGLNLIMPGLIALSLSAAFGLMAGALFAVAGIVAIFGPLTNSRMLEEMSGEPPKFTKSV
jgi:putative MFS transporter